MRAPPGARVDAVRCGLGRTQRPGDRLACPGPRGAWTPGLLAGLAVSSQRRSFCSTFLVSPCAPSLPAHCRAGGRALSARTLRVARRGPHGWCWLWAAQTPCPPPLRGQGRAAADFGENVGLLFKEILYLALYTRPLTRFFPRMRLGVQDGRGPGAPHLLLILSHML